MSLSLTILGCGSSGGVPRPGSGWGACDPDNPRNRRRRCSILVQRHIETGDVTNVLVDTSPDLRDQLLTTQIKRLDGILMTHAHADHVHGIDDVRPLVILSRKRIAMYMDQATSDTVTSRFDYIFQTPQGSQYPALLDAQILAPGHACSISGPGGSINAMPFALDHGDCQALGFRFGDVAYTPDVVGIPEDAVKWLVNLDVWIIDALRYTQHPSHFSLNEALEWISRVKPRHAILTNLHTDMDYATLKRELPDGVEPAWDGMQVQIAI